ncbi:MAG: hypothetical protein R3F49_24345 [Planctomycetota bacterium]
MPPITATLTRRQRDIVEFFARYVQAEGISPTLDEIAAHFGVNKVTIFGHVAELERKGVLRRREKGASRALEFVESDPRHAHRSQTLSILGTIAAGSPIEEIEDQRRSTSAASCRTARTSLRCEFRATP